MSERNGDDADNTSGYEVNDEENKSQTATIRRIQKFRDELAEYQLLFAQNELTQEISEAEQHRSYYQLASGFLQLLTPYLTDDKLKNSSYYWNGYTGDSLETADEQLVLGQVTITPPDAIRQPDQSAVENAIKVGDIETVQRADPRNDVSPRSYSVIGLRDFAAAQAEWEEEWQVMYGPEVSTGDLRSQINADNVHIASRDHRNQPITIIKRARLPKRVIDNAITAMENFIRDVGMDVQFNEGTPTITGFDQSGEEPSGHLTRTSGLDEDPDL